MKRVVIVGMGFGGLNAARALAGKGLEVLLLDRHNYHLFQPLLYQVAPVAIQQGKHAGEVILSRERGREVAPFRYHDRGSMAIIGRYAAVAKAYGVDVTGLPAWLTWLGLHLYYLIGFRNRLMALLNWAYAFLLMDPKLRLLVPECLSGSAYGQPAHRAERDAKKCGQEPAGS